MKRTIPLLLAALLAGCFGEKLESTLPSGAPPSEIGRVLPALEPAEAADAMRRLRTGLAAQLAGVPPPAVKGDLRDAGAENLSLQLETAGLFEADSAQLRVEALSTCAAVASALRAQPGFVIHAVVYGDTDSGIEASLRLPARRAAALGEELSRQGVPAARVRAEGRLGSARADLVFQPVIEGREATAWMPPP